MKRILFFTCGLTLFALLFGATLARACEPCAKEKVLKFEATARAADLVIVGQRYDFKPDELTHGIFGPETIRVKILSTLKGEVSEQEITVKSWSGMCPYGVVINDNEPHVIFLKKSTGVYRAVDECSLKTLSVKDDMVEMDGKKESLEDFRSRLQQLGSRPRTISSELQKPDSFVINLPATAKIFYSVIVRGTVA